jgi:hypothetical protein
VRHPEAFAVFAVAVEFRGFDIAVDGTVPRGRAQVLADGYDVDADGA